MNEEESKERSDDFVWLCLCVIEKICYFLHAIKAFHSSHVHKLYNHSIAYLSYGFLFFFFVRGDCCVYFLFGRQFFSLLIFFPFFSCK